MSKTLLGGAAKKQPTMLQLNGATGSDYNEEWTIKLQAGLDYHVIELATNLVKHNTVEKITVDINGTPVCYISGKMIDLMEKAQGKYKKQGRFVLDLSRFEYRSPAGIYQTQLVTNLTDDVTLKIKFGAKDAADPAKPTLKGKAWVTDRDKAGRLFVPKMYELVQHAAAAGEHNWTFPNGSPYHSIQRIIFDESEANITKIKLKRGERTIHTMERADLDFALKRFADITPQPGYCILDMTLFGYAIHGAINTANLSFELEVDNSGAIKTFVQGYEQVAFPNVAR